MKCMKYYSALAAVLLAGCAAPAPQELPLQARFDAMIRAGFQANGQATLDRLDQDATQKLCSEEGAASDTNLEDARAKLEEANLKTVRPPADGQYLGDWKQGEAIAQSGRGLTWTDAAGTPNGGNCYNCHQIDKKEISFGTIGPSLWNYGKLRGVADPKAPESQPIVQYTWTKLWNAKSYNACSNMPRFGPREGHAGILTEAQIRHVMALLLDPKSPVNQ